MSDMDSISSSSVLSSHSSKHDDRTSGTTSKSSSLQTYSSWSSKHHQAGASSHRSHQAASSLRSSPLADYFATQSYQASHEVLERKRPKQPSSPGLSAEEFKTRLYRSFKERGLVDSLKSQLRTKLVAELQQSALIEHRQNADSKPLPEGTSLLHRAANSLVADHLKRCGYDYSLAVFLPESESAKDKLFTIHDLLELLKIHPDSKLGRKLIAELSSGQSKGLLWQFLCEVARSHHGGSEEKGIQVDEHPAHLTSLESKLKSVDKLYNSKLDNLSEYGTMDDKLLSLQRQMEARFKLETNMEVSRFKESELKRVELVERDKCRKEIAKARKEMEYTYRAKSEALQERERSAMERLQKEREHVERETYAQRQSLLEELQVLRQREKELKREADVNARAAKLEEDRCTTMEENLKVRESSVSNIQETYDRRFKEQTRQFELEIEAKYKERFREIDERDSKLNAEKRNLQQESEALKGLKDEVKEKERRLKELETLLQQMRHDAMSTEKRNEVLNDKVRDMIDYQSVKETNAVLRRELENSKMRLSEVTNEHRIEKARHEEMVKQMADQMSRPSPELVTLQGDLTRAKQQIQHEKTIMDHKETQLKDKLHNEKEQILELRRQLEEQSRQMADMNKQLLDLRGVLTETQTALQNEIYRRPTAGPSAQAPYARSPTELVPVHDHVEPEDQYLDTTLRQTRIDPHLMLREQPSDHPRLNTVRQRLLADDDMHRDLQPMRNLNTLSTLQPMRKLDTLDTMQPMRNLDTSDTLQPMRNLDTSDTLHQSFEGRQRLLATEDDQENTQPMIGHDTTIQRQLHDVGNSRMFAPMNRLEATVTDDGDVSADNSLAFLEETRQRFKQLDKEAENLEQTYHNFQHRVLNPQAVPSSPDRTRTRTQTQHDVHPLASLEFGTPLPARQTDTKDIKPSSPPEPLIEYPLRDSMESANTSQFRTLPPSKTCTGSKLIGATAGKKPLHDSMESSAPVETSSHYRTLPLQRRLETTEVTQLENFPMDSRLDSTELTENAKSILSTNKTSVPQPSMDVPLQVKGVHGIGTVTLPPYEEIETPRTVKNQPIVASGGEQRVLPEMNRDQSSDRFETHQTKREDVSVLPDQSQVRLRSHRDSSVSSLSEHSLPLGEDDTAYGSIEVFPKNMAGTTDVSPHMTRENVLQESSADKQTDQANRGGSLGYDLEEEQERLRRLREEEEQEEREWEEKRRQKEEERKQREADARERERQMLLELQRQEERSSSPKDEAKEAEEKDKLEDPDEDRPSKAEDTKEQDTDLQIDQKYMQMVQQRKQQESSGSKVTGPKEEEDDDEESVQKASILSGLSQASISGVESDGIEKENSQKLNTDDEDPFDDW